MNRVLFIVMSIVVNGLLGCASTPKAVQEQALLAPVMPDPSGTYTSLDLILRELEGPDAARYDLSKMARLAVIGTDSLIAIVALNEYPSLLYVDVWVLNGTSQSLYMSPDMIALVDGAKTQFRRLEPHEAANVFASQIRGIPTYQPKTSYRVDTYQYGNYSPSDVTPYTSVGESMAQLGTAIVAASVRKKNEQLLAAASHVYAQGLVPGTEILSDANLRFGVYFLNQVKSYPLEVRILGDIRIPFYRYR